MPTKRTGRPPGPRAKLNEEITSRMVSALGSGSYREQAARYAGIGMTTMYRYLEKGEADEAEDKQSPEREFRERVLGAEADAEIRAVGLIRQAAQGRPESRRVLDDGTVLTTPAQPPTWQAAAWLLERKHPDRWGRRSRLDVDANVTADIEVVHNKAVEVVPDADRRLEVAKILEEALGGAHVN